MYYFYTIITISYIGVLINSYIQKATLFGDLNMPIYESKLVNFIFGGLLI
jgi:hypothetical protein